ncbi:hypothetical protein RJ639_034348 [Escallonia herrerae]|uniref:Protein kinase domain-containing protein n=1 Tax=Escallonia herrerae TaxID=1293975 RepID=A0AA88WUV1_9ASTE|nr:hypothetical protein RJ639_034348 [Escallonia herrerae]
MAAQESTWILQLLEDLHQPIEYPISLYRDNFSAIRLAENPVFHARTKHVEVHYHFIREKVLQEEIELEHIKTENQVADLLTKSLSENTFQSFCHQLGMANKGGASVEGFLLPSELEKVCAVAYVSDLRVEDRDELSGGRPLLYALPREHMGSQQAMSLPSSPHEFRNQTSERSGVTDEMVSAWNKVLKSPMFQNKPLLPFQEWNIDYSELTVGTRVGIGFFGEVFRGIWNGTEVAIKVFLEQDLTAENMEDFCNEISILSRLRHPNDKENSGSACIFDPLMQFLSVILFLGACTKPPRLSMVTEYMEMGSLFYLIHLSSQKKKLSWRRRLKMLRDICRGLMCLHRMKLVHRDLKSANCLVNKHWTVKICDFGLSRMMTDGPLRDSSSAGTPEWMAPELIRNEPFTEKCDIFSLGVIIWELYTLNRPWYGVPPQRNEGLMFIPRLVKVVYAVANEGSRLEIPEGPLGRLITDCWAEPHDRPSCEGVLTRLLDCEYLLS